MGKFKLCIEKMEDLIDSVDKLKLSLHGQNVIFDKFKKAEETCGRDFTVQRRIVETAIERWKMYEELGPEVRRTGIELSSRDFDLANSQLKDEFIDLLLKKGKFNPVER